VYNISNMEKNNQQNNAENQLFSVDDLDNKIISALDSDARTPLEKIAKNLKISRQTVDYRLKKLKREGIFLGDLVIFDTGILGYGWYRILIRLLNVSKTQKNEFLDFLAKHPQTTWLGEVGGRWDIVVNLACTSPINFNSVYEEISVKFGHLIKAVEVLVYLDTYDYSRSYLDVKEFKTNEFFHRMDKDNSFKISKLDKLIIKSIKKDACFSYSELGKKLEVSRNTIKQRIKKLMQKKVILGFRSFINLQKLGYQSNMLFLQINCLDRERETELYYYLKMLPEVTFVVKHIGEWQIGMEIETKTALEFHNILITLRSQFSDLISDYETFPLIKDHCIDYFPDGVLEKL